MLQFAGSIELTCKKLSRKMKGVIIIMFLPSTNIPNFGIIIYYTKCRYSLIAKSMHGNKHQLKSLVELSAK